MTGKMIGIVLAGGQSRRFGSPKAFAKKDGKEFYQYSIDAIKQLVNSVVISTNDQLEKNFSITGYEMITDIEKFKEKGPLAGIYTVMNTFSAEWYMVIPVDVPFMNER